MGPIRCDPRPGRRTDPRRRQPRLVRRAATQRGGGVSQFSTPRPEPERDRWGRYVIPDPDTGKKRTWMRATTFAKTLSDMYGLGKWQERMVAKGVSLRSDLYALAAATPVADETKFDKICADAKEAAKATSGANLGTALHAFTEQIDMGQKIEVPAPWDADIAAYQAALAEAKIRVDRQWIERIVLVPQYGVAGTLDRIVWALDQGRTVADVKTGKDLSYSWCEISIQLALYANATHTYDLATGDIVPMPEVNQDKALVFHLPVGQGRCEIHEVDIKAGWEAAYWARIVRDWRARKNIATSYRISYQPTLDDQIARAPDRTALEALYGQYRGDWTDAHTAAAQARVAALNSAGTPGGAQETAIEGALA